jgi:hypothetical protein
LLIYFKPRFVRMWEFYLACSEMAFRESDMVVFQIQLAKRKGVTSATRDYIAREEARLRVRERGAAAAGRRIVRPLWRKAAVKGEAATINAPLVTR